MRRRSRAPIIGTAGLLGVLVSCSVSLDFDKLRRPVVDDGGTPIEAGVDATVIGDAGIDAASDGPPGPTKGVQCGAVLCEELCCAETTRVCATSQTCNSVFSNCDEPEDCPNIGEVCCTELRANGALVAKCEPSCPGEEDRREVCRPGTSCRTGQCAPYDAGFWVCPN